MKTALDDQYEPGETDKVTDHDKSRNPRTESFQNKLYLLSYRNKYNNTVTVKAFTLHAPSKAFTELF